MPKQLVQLTVTQQCTATISPLDEKQNPATLTSSVWSCSDETVATIVPSDDGLSCEIIGGAPGNARVVCNADAATEKGSSKPLVALVQVTVVAGKAATIDMEVTDPVEQGTDPTKPVRPDNTLPGGPVRPGNALPGGGASTKPTPPGSQPPVVDAGLPGAPARPGTGLPPKPGEPGYKPPDPGTKPV